MVRGKYRCMSVTFATDVIGEGGGDWADRVNSGPRQYAFSAIYDTSTPEDARFTRATPWGEVKMGVDNPLVSFQVGKLYYLDLTPVEA